MLDQKKKQFSLVVLVDNTPHPKYSNLQAEHGLSIYFELGDSKYLFDVGASDVFYENAQFLNIDISLVDYLFISHAHKDHTGGINKFLEINKKATIYLSNKIVDHSFYSCRQGCPKDISMPDIDWAKYESRIKTIRQNTKVNDDVSLVVNIGDRYNKPKGNNTLYTKYSGEMKNDDFGHEMALMLNVDGKKVILSACTHNGILNTLSACIAKQEEYDSVISFIGGTHLLDSDDQYKYESVEEIKAIARLLKQDSPNLELITGHCTGKDASIILKEQMGYKFRLFYTGFQYRV